MTLVVKEDTESGIAILNVTGRLDSNTASDLEPTLFERTRNEAAVLLDMQAVPYISSAGLRVLLGAAKIARATGTRLALCGLAPQVHEVLQLSGFARAFETFGTRADVMDAMSAT
ncbi:STAS domain-containing protein [Mesorhizobium sp. CAU 1741]|uniref:STAS domain-containing protein n=1 Tax=Mesorhizobium sp. CAU 1741 TaxID=3140366 RepID=UPI00325AE0B7